jgi:hypothetical protein
MQPKERKKEGKTNGTLFEVKPLFSLLPFVAFYFKY